MRAYQPSDDRTSLTRGWRKPVLALVLFGVAFGYLEAAVVSYLRALHESARQNFHPERRPDELFPLLTLDQVRAAGEAKTLFIETGREAATMLMLAAIALATAKNFGQWGAAFVIAFGVWDITFYLFLKLLLGWPSSLRTWDILFLIPVPWVAPVLAPMLVAAAMIAGGVWFLRNDTGGRRVRIAAWQTAGIFLGGVVIIFAFTLDYPNIAAGGLPNPFHWNVFTLGMAIGVGSYVHAAVRAPLRERTAAASKSS